MQHLSRRWCYPKTDHCDWFFIIQICTNLLRPQSLFVFFFKIILINMRNKLKMEINFLPKVRVTEMNNFVVFTVGRSMCDWMRLYFYVATILFSWSLANMGALCDLCCRWSAWHDTAHMLHIMLTCSCKVSWHCIGSQCGYNCNIPG